MIVQATHVSIKTSQIPRKLSRDLNDVINVGLFDANLLSEFCTVYEHFITQQTWILL